VSQDPQNWIGGAITAICAAITGLLWTIRRILISVTREEMLAALKEMDDRHVATVERLERRHDAHVADLRETLLALHEANSKARHTLNDTVAGPLNRLNAELIRLRERLDKPPPRECEE